MQIADEEGGPLVVGVATLRDKLTHDPHLQTEALIDTVHPDLAANSIPMFLPALREVAVQLDLLRTLALLTALVPVPRLDAAAMNGAVQHSADLDPAPAPDPPLIEAAEEKEDAARTMVIATDPKPRVNYPAHVLPDEAEAGRVPSPAA